jgi:hypothetical protein
MSDHSPAQMTPLVKQRVEEVNIELRSRVSRLRCGIGESVEYISAIEPSSRERDEMSVSFD